jgi:hypothetical protein
MTCVGQPTVPRQVTASEMNAAVKKLRAPSGYPLGREFFSSQGRETSTLNQPRSSGAARLAAQTYG